MLVGGGAVPVSSQGGFFDAQLKGALIVPGSQVALCKDLLGEPAVAQCAGVLAGGARGGGNRDRWGRGVVRRWLAAAWRFCNQRRVTAELSLIVIPVQYRYEFEFSLFF